ncbi:hypothetical protein [Jiangella endophytica]|uniref:hypothetical protein n=1 Tax=Jiangella endophytica TaxID=1623398 RepID=UPI000E340EF4|nr:hypothetical protein [Jiangella endophytica]
MTLEELERQRFCAIKDAAVYLGRTYAFAHQLVKEQKIASVYQGYRRMVVVKSLKAYADRLPIDHPDA